MGGIPARHRYPPIVAGPPSEVVRVQFTGYESEHLSGVQYAGARFYDPVLGQFLSHDPAGAYASPYAYVGWDPVNGTDPSGAFPLSAFFVLVGVFLGLGSLAWGAIQVLSVGLTTGDWDAR